MSNKLQIKKETCDNSPFCPVKRVCPRGAVYHDGEKWQINQEKCAGCGICYRVCPTQSVYLVK